MFPEHSLWDGRFQIQRLLRRWLSDQFEDHQPTLEVVWNSQLDRVRINKNRRHGPIAADLVNEVVLITLFVNDGLFLTINGHDVLGKLNFQAVAFQRSLQFNSLALGFADRPAPMSEERIGFLATSRKSAQ